MRVVNAYTVVSDDIKVGDVMLFTVKAIVLRRDADDKLRYRIYRSAWEGDAVPQGSQVSNMREVAEALFSSLAMVGEPG